MRRLALLALLAVGACVPPVDPAERLRADRMACAEAGFDPASDAFKLCLLIQDQNRRIDHLERRVQSLDLELNSFGLLGRPWRLAPP